MKIHRQQASVAILKPEYLIRFLPPYRRFFSPVEIWREFMFTIKNHPEKCWGDILNVTEGIEIIRYKCRLLKTTCRRAFQGISSFKIISYDRHCISFSETAIQTSDLWKCTFNKKPSQTFK